MNEVFITLLDYSRGMTFVFPLKYVQEEGEDMNDAVERTLFREAPIQIGPEFYHFRSSECNWMETRMVIAETNPGMINIDLRRTQEGV